MSQYELLNTKIIALFFISFFQLIIINRISIRANLSIKMVTYNFSEKDAIDQNHIDMQIQNFIKIFVSKNYRAR